VLRAFVRARRVRHTERVAYHGNGNGHGHGHAHAAGTVVRCEPERVYYRPVRAETRVVTKTKMKRVCRDVPVKTRVIVAQR
jgi:hypothetical protein